MGQEALLALDKALNSNCYDLCPELSLHDNVGFWIGFNKAVEIMKEAYPKNLPMLPNELEVDKVNRLISQSLPEEQHELVSDGYHTFKELYAHRVALFIALCNTLIEHESDVLVDRVWKSKFHSDGGMYPGWFIAGIRVKNKNITYHLPISEWDGLYSYELDTAPEWDGSKSEDVLNLIRNNF